MTGIGQRAYKMLVPGLGDTPTVRVLDGNAVITSDVFWLASDDVPPPPDGIFDALTETIRGTTASIQKG